MWYRDSVIQKIKERSWKYEGVPGTYIDIVNVINATSVHWAADRLVWFLPLLSFIFFRVKIWLSSFSVRSSIENQREPLWIVHRARDLRYVRNFGEYLSLTYWRDGIADILYLSSSTDSLLTSFKRSKSDVCFLSGWPSLVSAITNMAFPCAGQPYRPVLSFKPWLLKMYWKSRLKVHLYV